MTTIDAAILALLDVSYEQTADEITKHVLSHVDNDCRELVASDVAPFIRELIRERWLYYAPDSMKLRRRTPAQHATLMAANNPNQGRLM